MPGLEGFDVLGVTQKGGRKGSGLTLKRPTARAKIFAPGTTLNALYLGMLADPFSSVNMMSNLTDTALMQNNGYEPSDPSQVTRRPLLAMATDKNTRPAIISSLLADLHDRSDQIERAIDKAQASGAVDLASQVYDYISFGAGIHDQILSNAITNAGASLKGLTITDTDGIADTFALPGDFFRLNSTNRATQAGIAPAPGRGNLNEQPGGPVQVPDIDHNKDPSARSLADAAVMNRASGSADILFRNTIGKVTPKGTSKFNENWPADFRVEIFNAKGERRYVYTNRVVDLTGIGEPDFQVKDQETTALVNESVEETARDPMAPTGVWYFADFARRAGLSDTPYREFVGKKVTVVGGRDKAKGDSAKVTLEWLLRLAPPEAYGRDVSQMGLVGSIDWAGVSAKDCVEYINNTRTRYAGIASGFKSGIVQSVDGQLDTIRRRPGGGFVLTYKMRDGSTKTEETDYVVLTTGFKLTTYKRYSNIVQADSFGVRFDEKTPLQNSDAVEEVQASVPGVTGKTAVAKKLKGYKIYFGGPNAGKIVDPGEQAGVTENAGSIYATGRRTFALGELLAKEKPGDFPTLPRSEPTVITLAKGKAPLPALLTRPLPTAPIRAFQPGQKLYLRARLTSAMAEFKIPSKTMKITLSFQRLESGGYALETKPAFNESPALAETLNRDARFVDALASVLNGANNQLSITADMGAAVGGGPAMSELSLSRSFREPSQVVGLPEYVFSARPVRRSETREQIGPAYASKESLIGLGADYASYRAGVGPFRSEYTSTYLLSRALRGDPEKTRTLFDSFLQSGKYGSLTNQEGLKLFTLSQLRPTSSVDQEQLQYIEFLKTEEGDSLVKRESQVQLFILGELLNRDPVKLVGEFQKFEASAAENFGTKSESEISPIFFVAKILGRDVSRLYSEYDQFRKARGTRRDDQESQVLYALAKLADRGTAQLSQEFDEFSDDPRVSRLTTDEKLSLFVEPYARRSRIDAKQALFLVDVF